MQHSSALPKKNSNKYFPTWWVEHDAEEIWSTQYGTMAKLCKAYITMKQVAGMASQIQRETTVVWERSNGKTNLLCYCMAGQKNCCLL
jgi:glycerol kinase